MNRYAPIFALVALATLVANAKTDRPNILYFYVDDMGWGALSPNGQAEREAKGLPRVITPNLDRFAAEGVNFSRSYGCTVCSPARSSQQSGFHQGHTFADRNDPDNAKKALRTDDVLMGDALSAAGYVTGYWGKWGYGGSKSQPDPVIQNIQTLPTSHGYQHVVAELHHVRAHTFFQPTLWTAPAAPGSVGDLYLAPNSMAKYKGDKAYPNTPALQNHSDYPATAYCDDVYAFAALDFVRAQAKNYNATGQPFLGLLAVQVPHAPFREIEQLPEWNQAYRDDPRFASLSDQTNQWVAMVTRIDGHFGNILAALEDPNGDGDTSDSVADNTLVVFQSDNGGPGNEVREELDINGGLRGSKGSIFEGGIRVPTMMRWPSKITGSSTLKAGTSTRRIIDVTDMFPTFCDLAGVPAPAGIDGVSLAPTILGEGHQRPRAFVIHEAGKYQSIIRGKHKLIRSATALELYNLEIDRAETNNIADAHPALVKKLETLLLGERVDEERGFANTYHRWAGKNGAATSSADNWSDYAYSNAGITYLTDSGAPRVSWTAFIENSGSSDANAIADADLEFLGLEIRGNAKNAAKQTLTLGSEISLTGRNEIRISENATLAVNGGKVSSLRWIEVESGGVLNGTGNVDATLYNEGIVSVTSSDHSGDRELNIDGDYRELDGSVLNITLPDHGEATLQVEGRAQLSGALAITVGDNFKAKVGKKYTILAARKIDGKLNNARQQVVSNKSNLFQIDYTPTAVTVTIVR